MSRHFLRQLEKLKRILLSLGGLVEESVEDAIRAIESNDVDLARNVIENDSRIDALEVEVEEECLHTLALYQPVASDLRFVASVIKINKDLERIGDLAGNLAREATYPSNEPRGPLAAYDLAGESTRVRMMLKKSLDALVNNDCNLAEEVRAADDEVDELHRAAFVQVRDELQRHPEHAAGLLDLLNVSKQLERIADHTVSIADDVIYMCKGAITRHERDPPPKPRCRFFKAATCPAVAAET